jgi:hypothetical protein
MGPLASPPADPSVTDAADPFDYVERDDLLCRIRAHYEQNPHFRITGPQLDRVCFGVLHNQQRLWLLTKWWRQTGPEPFLPPAVPTAAVGLK